MFAPLGRQHWESPHLGAHHWGVNFRVHDLDAIVAQLRYVGIAVEVDHDPHPSGRVALLHDPEGNEVQALGARVSGRRDPAVRLAR